MKNKYAKYLLNIVGGANRANFSKLLKMLQEREFYALVPNDDNRAADGLELRRSFAEEEGAQALSSFRDEPCSLLEMLIGVAIRMQLELADTEWDRGTDDWFWFLMKNLDLDWCTNFYMADDDSLEHVVTVCDTFLNRRYKSDGKGGLFPLKNAKKDQKKVEIWYQMSAFIMENFPF